MILVADFPVVHLQRACPQMYEAKVIVDGLHLSLLPIIVNYFTHET